MLDNGHAKKCQKKRRDKLKSAISSVSQSNEDAAKALKSFNRGKVGRPSIDVDQPTTTRPLLWTNSLPRKNKRNPGEFGFYERTESCYVSL